LAKVQKVVEEIGARVMIVSPDEHDVMAAAISHLPHLVASTLVKTAAKIDIDNPNTLLLAAGGFKDTTRIASGNPSLWKDICFSNKTELLNMIEVFKEEFVEFERQLAFGLTDQFESDLRFAKTVRDKIPAKLKGYWPFLDEIIVTIPDKPGMIGQVAAILGEQAINIDDIEILHVREGEGGTLRLGFAKEGLAKKAVQVLEKHGFSTRMKAID
jgi:prephenate dehydrogenase